MDYLHHHINTAFELLKGVKLCQNNEQTSRILLFVIEFCNQNVNNAELGKTFYFNDIYHNAVF